MVRGSKGRGDPDDIIRRDDYTCQKCGYTATDSDETMVAHFIGSDKSNPDHYETRCQDCGRTLYQRFNHKMNRILRYLAALQFGGVGVGFGVTSIFGAFYYPFWTEAEGLYLIMVKTVVNSSILLFIGILSAVISLQIAIWIEPPNGIIYRVVDPLWKITGGKIVGKIKNARKVAMNQLR